MNYIGDILLEADKENIERNKVKFVPAKVFSPYIEILFENINETSLPDNNIIEVNQYYRFEEIFKELFDINVKENYEFREVTFDILIHYLGELDLKMGFCKEEFYKKFLLRDILNNVYGESLAKNIHFFNKEELDSLLSGLICLYKTGTSIKLFTSILKKIFKNSTVYISKDRPKDIYIYLNEIKNQKLEYKINEIIDTFLPINIRNLVFWNKHFGIIGENRTMKLNNIVMVK